jgi:hypothetical protein
MLRVRTYLAPSSIHGIGVFAAESIPKGTVVWRYDSSLDQRVTVVAFDGMPQIVQDFLVKYAWKQGDSWWFCSDNFRFVNHSRTPILRGPVEDPSWSSIAVRDIYLGEELTENYSDYDEDWSRYGSEFSIGE